VAAQYAAVVVDTPAVAADMLAVVADMLAADMPVAADMAVVVNTSNH
jgi:hypothetical protein